MSPTATRRHWRSLLDEKDALQWPTTSRSRAGSSSSLNSTDPGHDRGAIVGVLANHPSPHTCCSARVRAFPMHRHPLHLGIPGPTETHAFDIPAGSLSFTTMLDDRQGGPTLTSAATNAQQATAPPPPPAEISYRGQCSVNPLAEVSFRRMCGRIPAVLGRITRLSWRTARRAVQLLLGCQVVTGVSAAVLLPTFTLPVPPRGGTGNAEEKPVPCSPTAADGRGCPAPASYPSARRAA